MCAHELQPGCHEKPVQAQPVTRCVDAQTRRVWIVARPSPRALASHQPRGSRFAPPSIMLTILIVIGLIALLGGGLGYGRFGAAGLSPAALIILILIVLALTGRL